MLKKIIIITWLLPIFSANAQKIKTRCSNHKYLITERFAMDTVLQLSEIKEANAYVRKKTKGQRHLFSMIYGKPDNLHPYYRVVVGEDNGMNFVTHFTFFVYTNRRKILYYDTSSERAIDLNAWRRKLHGK